MYIHVHVQYTVIESLCSWDKIPSLLLLLGKYSLDYTCRLDWHSHIQEARACVLNTVMYIHVHAIMHVPVCVCFL